MLKTNCCIDIIKQNYILYLVVYLFYFRRLNVSPAKTRKRMNHAEDTEKPLHTSK